MEKGSDRLSWRRRSQSCVTKEETTTTHGARKEKFHHVHHLRKEWNSIYDKLKGAEDGGQGKEFTIVWNDVQLQDMLHILNTQFHTLEDGRITTQELVQMMVVWCKCLPIQNMLLCSEFNRWIQKQAHLWKPSHATTSDDVGREESKTQIQYGSAHDSKKTLFINSVHHFDIIANFYLKLLRGSTAWYQIDTLKTFSLILYGNSKVPFQYVNLVLDFCLLHLQDCDQGSLDMQHTCITCIANIYVNLVGRQDLESNISEYNWKIFSCLIERTRSITLGIANGNQSLTLVQICTEILYCLQHIIAIASEETRLTFESRLVTVLASFRDLVGFGYDSSGIMDISWNLHSQSPSSDLDSDSSSRNDSSRTHGELSSTLRLSILEFLQILTQFYKGLMNESISLYIPDCVSPGFRMYNRRPSILSLLQVDPSRRVRCQVAAVLHCMIELLPMKQLAIVISNTRSTSTKSFISRSEQLSGVVGSIYLALVDSLHNEDDAVTLLQVLKTMNAILGRSPQQLIDSCVVQVMKELHALLHLPDHAIRLASAQCISAYLSREDDASKDLRDWVIEPPTFMVAHDEKGHENKVEDGIVEATHEKHDRSALIASRRGKRHCGLKRARLRENLQKGQMCLLEDLVGFASTSTPLRHESMSLLCKIARQGHDIILPMWTRLLEPLISSSFGESDSNVRLHSIKIYENFIRGFKESKAKNAPTEPLPRFTLHFLWEKLRRGLGDSSHHVRAGVCVCMLALEEQDWKQVCLTFNVKDLFSGIYHTALDHSEVVRAAGTRLLGTLVLLKPFQTREFLFPVLKQCLHGSMLDASLNVRLRASWTISNICGSFLRPVRWTDYRSVSFNEFNHCFAPISVLEVSAKLLDSADDDDKVVANVVRAFSALGTLLLALSMSGMEHAREASAYFEQVMYFLLRKLESDVAPKVQWNTCHAISRILLLDYIPLNTAVWAPVMFQRILQTLKVSNNYKARISLVTTLRIPKHRTHYGTSYDPILGTLVELMGRGGEATKASLGARLQLKYVEQFEIQISLTFCHLVQMMATPSDHAVVQNRVGDQAKKAVLDQWFGKRKVRLLNVITERMSEDDLHPSSLESTLEEEPRRCVPELHDILKAARRLIEIGAFHESGGVHQFVSLLEEFEASQMKMENT